MKVISKDDLLLLIRLITDRKEYTLDDFELILNRFGDDYFVQDGQWNKTKENKEMASLREQAKREGIYEHN